MLKKYSYDQWVRGLRPSRIERQPGRLCLVCFDKSHAALIELMDFLPCGEGANHWLSGNAPCPSSNCAPVICLELGVQPALAKPTKRSLKNSCFVLMANFLLPTVFP